MDACPSHLQPFPLLLFPKVVSYRPVSIALKGFPLFLWALIEGQRLNHELAGLLATIELSGAPASKEYNLELAVCNQLLSPFQQRPIAVHGIGESQT